MKNEERLNDIEIKLAALEDLVETLNQTIYRQDNRIAELSVLCSALARRVKDSEAAAELEVMDEKPPHY